MRKRLLSAVLCIAVIFSAGVIVSADEGEAAAKELVLSLEDAVKMAQERSPKLEAVAVTEETTEYSLKIAKQNKAKVEKAVIKFPSGLSTALMRDGYYVKQLESSLALLQSEKEQINASIAYNVTEKYYNYILMQNLLKSAQDTYNLAVENKTAVDAKLSLGAIAEIEAENAELTVLSAELAVENYERQLALAEETLKIALEFTDEEYKTIKLVLTDKIEYEEFTADVNADAELAKVQRYDMKSLSSNVELVSVYTELVRGYLGNKSTTYTDSVDNLSNLQYNYNNASKQIGVAIKSQYSSVLQAKGNIKTAEMTQDVKKRQYEAAKLRFDLGLITNIELTDQLNDLHDSETALEQAKMNYKLAVIKYKYEVEIGL